jgi:hypothetical protein
VRVRRTHDKFTPVEPFYFVALLQTQKPFSCNNGAIPFIDVGSDNASAVALAASPVDAYYYSQLRKQTVNSNPESQRASGHILGIWKRLSTVGRSFSN